MNPNPPIPASHFDELIPQIIPSKHCNRADCRGRGFVGVRENEDKTKTLLLCPCATYGDTPYVVMVKKMREEIFLSEMRLARLIAERFDRLENLTLIGRMRSIGLVILKLKTKGKP